MANRNYANSRIYSGHVMPVHIDCKMSIGSSGATSSLTGAYVTSVTRQGAGAYKIVLDDKYSKLYSLTAQCSAITTGSALNISDGLTSGKMYVINAVGTSTAANWQAVGLPTGITPAAGVAFVASTSSAGTGTGTVKAVTASGVQKIELVGSPQLAPSTGGAVIMIQCFAPTDATTTTLIPADPASGSTLSIQMLLSNSSVLVNGS